MLIQDLTKSLVKDLTQDLIFEDGEVPPIPVTDGLVLWLDAADASTITEVGNVVSQWDDKSGNDNHVTQGTGSKQPTYHPTGLNGLPTIRGDGVDDLLQRTTFTGGALTDPVTIFLVYGCTTGGGANRWAISGGSAADPRFIVRPIANSGVFQAPTCCFVSTTTGFDNGSFVISLESNSASSLAWVNGVSEAISGWISTNVANGVTLFSRFSDNQHLDGNISEVLFYEGSLSTEDRQKMENYLLDKWIP